MSETARITIDDFTTDELFAIADSVIQIVNSINQLRAEGGDDTVSEGTE